VQRLLGKNDIEDALKRLDTLTMEEARMAIAENLKVTNRVDDKVDKVDSKVDKVDGKVDKVDDKVDKVGEEVGKVDNKVTVLIDGAQKGFLWLLAHS
jgi:peptidoglycan hydrolase CwlO-like protein